jgi:hypothetical protein
MLVRAVLPVVLGLSSVAAHAGTAPSATPCYRVYVVTQRSDDLTFLDWAGHRLGAVRVGRNPHEVAVSMLMAETRHAD